jgi:hypothetical protein
VVRRLVSFIEAVVLVRCAGAVILLCRLDAKLHLIAARRMAGTIEGDLCRPDQSHRALGDNRILSLHGTGDDLSARSMMTLSPVNSWVR